MLSSARVRALFPRHRKTQNPFFFIENQPPGFENPHEGLEPEASAAVIIQHVPDGLDLAEKFRLPGRIQEFIREHHGTMVTRYQYVSAVNKAGGDLASVSLERFSYPGPKPLTRETALVMLADGCEARARSEIPQSEEQVALLVQNVIEDRRTSGQLDFTDLTTRDLKVISEVFSSTMRGFYHPRILYPKFETPTVPSPGAPGSVPTASGDKIEPEEQKPETRAETPARIGQTRPIVVKDKPGTELISRPDPSSPGM